MYGLPLDYDGACFLGRSPELVSFTANSIYISFDTNLSVDPVLSVTIMSSFEHRLGTAGDEPQVQTVPVESSVLMRVIGRAVATVEIERPGTLILRFDDGQVLLVFDDVPNYECYQITEGTRDIYV